MLELKLKTCTAQFPEDISEINSQQWYDLAQSYVLYRSGVLDFKAMSVRLVYQFLNMRRAVDVTVENNEQLTDNVAHLAQLLENLFTSTLVDGKQEYNIKLDFYTNPLPELIVNKHRYKGPSSLVSGTKFGDYIEAVNAYNDYARTNEAVYLERLINAWYKPVNHKVKITLEDVDAVHQLIIFLNFAATQKFIVNAKDLDIGGGIVVNLAALFKSSGSKQSNKTNFGLIGALYNLAKEGTFGNKETTAATDTWEVLTRMAQLHEDGKQQLKDAKKSRNKRNSR
jgi:hypothetical protein